MSLKNSITTADFLDFDKCLNRSMKIIKSEDQYKIAFLVIVGINSGLRISDLLSLKYKDFKGDTIDIKEKKTNKPRRISLNENIKTAYKLFLKRQAGKEIDDNELVFKSQKNTVYTNKSVNRLLQDLFGDSKKKLNISSHSLRKTFGRRVFSNNNENEKSLIYLSDIFNHSSIATTRRYLGIRQEEIENIYLNL